MKNKRPVTYQEWREVYHSALYDAGHAAKCFFCGGETFTSMAESRVRWARWVWYASRRAHRIEQRLHAYFDAMGRDVTEEIIRMAMEDGNG